MAITEENGNGFYMPVAPAYGGNANGFGGFGGDWGWIILLLLFAGGGWGMGGYGGGFGGMYEFPWLLNGQQGINANTNAGLQALSTQNQITAVQSDLGDIQTQLCGGFAGVNATINSTAAAAEVAANARAMANMQQMFDLSQQFSNCCCENRLAACQTQNTIQSESSATRFADANNTRDIIENANRNNQAVLDKLCQLELDAKSEKIADLERQLTMANLAASQTAQTAQLIADNTAQTQYVVNRVAPYPTPSYIVSNPNASNSCGCGCGV